MAVPVQKVFFQHLQVAAESGEDIETAPLQPGQEILVGLPLAFDQRGGKEHQAQPGPARVKPGPGFIPLRVFVVAAEQGRRLRMIQAVFRQLDHGLGRQFQGGLDHVLNVDRRQMLVILGQGVVKYKTLPGQARVVPRTAQGQNPAAGQKPLVDDVLGQFGTHDIHQQHPALPHKGGLGRVIAQFLQSEGPGLEAFGQVQRAKGLVSQATVHVDDQEAEPLFRG